MLVEYFLEYNRYLNLVGMVVVLAIAFLLSRNRAAISGKLVLHALILQMGIAFFILKTWPGYWFIQKIADLVAMLYQASEAGISFLFGALANPTQAWGFVFAIKVLPVIIFFGAFMNLLFYLGIIQRLVACMNAVIRPLLGTSGAETLCAVANSFLGQTEAPLLIRHYLARMTASELLVVMVSGMGTISGAILAVYAVMGIPVVHLLAASVMAIPSTILMAKLLYPETEEPETARGAVAVSTVEPAKNALGAIAAGTTDGLYLALNVGAMLIAFIALIGLANSLLAFGCLWGNKLLELCGFMCELPCVSIQMLLGILFAPFGWLLGLTGAEIIKAGSLIGTKLALNEMVAYSELLTLGLSERAVILMTYVLCGFANFSSIGIQVGGIGALAPEKRHVLAQLGVYAVVGGTLSSLLSAFIAGLFV
jgi:CNT family concentrative nucleoside transporter